MVNYKRISYLFLNTNLSQQGRQIGVCKQKCEGPILDVKQQQHRSRIQCDQICPSLTMRIKKDTKNYFSLSFFVSFPNCYSNSLGFTCRYRFKPCSHVTFAFTSTLKFNITSMVTQIQMFVWTLCYNVDVDPNVNVTLKRTFKQTVQIAY